MAETIIFLGAGASKDLQLPLSNELLAEILTRLGNETLFQGDAEAAKTVRACLGAIWPGFDVRSAGKRIPVGDSARLPSITDLLSTIDYLLSTGNAPGPAIDLALLSRARTLLERAIFEVLVRMEHPDALRMEGVPAAVGEEWENTYARHVLARENTPDAPARIAAANWILDQVRAGQKVTLISMNYDIEIEQELYRQLGYGYVFGRIDFGTPVREPAGGAIFPRPADALLSIYKLHGSLNWLVCSACDSLYVNPVGAIAYLSFLLDNPEPDDEWLQHLEAAGANQCHCLYRPLRHVIVAPSFVRNVHDPNVLAIWRSALAALRRADRWVLIGYSLPPEDVAIRSMLLRGYQARDDGRPPDVVVVQKGDSARAAYEIMFGDFTYHADGFQSYLASQSR
jgi:hypothetical protein